MLSRAAAVMGNIAFALEIHPSNKKYWTNLRKYAIDKHWKNNNQVGPVYAFKVHRDHGAVGRFQDNSFIYLLLQIFDVVDFYLKRLRISPLAQHNCDVEEVGDFSARFRLSAGVDFFYWLRP